jgi:hypothetical protein
MKYLFPFVIPLFLFSCSENKKEASSFSMNNAINKALPATDTVADKSKIDLEKVVSVINSVYNLDSIKLEKLPSDMRNVFEHLDSSNLIDYNRYLSFVIYEFDSFESSSNEFSKIIKISNSLHNRDNFTPKFYYLIHKGGVTHVLIDNFIVRHLLRCNMEKEHYKLDEYFVSELTKLSPNNNWTSYKCGWSGYTSKRDTIN